MRRHLLSLLSVALLCPVAAGEAQDVPPPEQALGYELGERFTTPAEVTDYARRLAEASDRVRPLELQRELGLVRGPLFPTGPEA